LEWLIHNQDFRILIGERLRDLRHLLLGDRETLYHGFGRNVQMQGLQQRIRRLILPLFIQHKALHGLPADEDIFRDGEILHQI